MVLRQPWLALALLGVVAGMALWRYATGLTARRPATGPRIAHADRIRRLPRFQALARHQARWLALDLAFGTVALAGALVLVARPTAVTAESREMRSRDVMLCLDVSGSMTNVDQVVIASYLELVGELAGERIGLVLWDSSGVMAFPLTDDYPFVEERLRAVSAALDDDGGDGGEEATAAELDARAVLDAAGIGDGSSLIGDGLTSCLLRFDQRAEDRPRTVVLATDNQLAGAPIFTLAEAGERAVTEGVLVVGITPGTAEGAPRHELRQVVEGTGGQLLDLTDDPAMEERIVHAVERRQRQAILGMPDARSFDQVWPGAAILAVGLAGMLVTVRARR